MPRALWTGSLSFGLVNVPVQLVTAVRDVDLHFRQLHKKDLAPIEIQRWCSKEQLEVPWEEIAHGYETDSGKQVIVTDEELSLIEPRKTRTIEVERFVDLADVDPVFFDHPYWMLPGTENEGALRAYHLLVEVMGKTERAALGRFVMRAKEYLAVIRVRDGALSLTTMRFHDEVRPTRGVGAPREAGEAREADARAGRRIDRGPRVELEAGALPGPLPRAASEGRARQAQGQDREAERAGRGAQAGARPDGGSDGVARGCQAQRQGPIAAEDERRRLSTRRPNRRPATSVHVRSLHIVWAPDAPDGKGRWTRSRRAAAGARFRGRACARASPCPQSSP
jgi:DNA end-binding protein Ku